MLTHLKINNGGTQMKVKGSLFMIFLILLTGLVACRSEVVEETSTVSNKPVDELFAVSSEAGVVTLFKSPT